MSNGRFGKDWARAQGKGDKCKFFNIMGGEMSLHIHTPWGCPPLALGKSMLSITFLPILGNALHNM